MYLYFKFSVIIEWICCDYIWSSWTFLILSRFNNKPIITRWWKKSSIYWWKFHSILSEYLSVHTNYNQLWLHATFATPFQPHTSLSNILFSCMGHESMKHHKCGATLYSPSVAVFGELIFEPRIVNVYRIAERADSVIKIVRRMLCRTRARCTLYTRTRESPSGSFRWKHLIVLMQWDLITMAYKTCHELCLPGNEEFSPGKKH